MFNNDSYIKGVFVEESKNRFLCIVLIENELCECYVPSSSRIENYLKLKGREVLLTANKGTNKRTKFSLFAVKYYNKYILINLNMVDQIVETMIIDNKIKKLSGTRLKREQTIEGYKADIMIENHGNNKATIIEVKGIISAFREARFPSVFSERAIVQLQKIKGLLQRGYKVVYLIVSLSPILKKINIDSNFSQYHSLLLECIELGMELRSFSVSFNEGRIEYKQKVSIINLG
ncbi:DNA/RNA nuclease SfsA [Paenibacillus doosanensis]|uniref:DNA/RNA nuclease SfsA n=1 Tax=Paenibacillus doosanensis TaxID=1229154 RepID=UPI0021804566|nr:DNA/RNA nuclease SfsA [Paenibacillus doosanensis]MCS7460378.1 DNA/RNA nuclease SfsA [Paenibacillus doosanensis]